VVCVSNTVKLVSEKGISKEKSRKSIKVKKKKGPQNIKKKVGGMTCHLIF